MNTVCADYDNILIGNSNTIDAETFYGLAESSQSESKAVACVRYLLTDVLGWTADEAVQKFDKYMMKLLKVDKLLPYIEYPPEIPEGDPKYILSLIYPDKVKLDQKKMAEEIYQTVLSASDDDDASLKQFPRDYFEGGKGFRRFCFCVTYLLDNYKPMSSVAETYKFLLSSEGKKFLAEFRLKVPADQFSINMIDVVHYITRDEPDTELYYNYYKFKDIYSKKMRKKIKEEKEAKEKEKKEENSNKE